MPLPMISLQLGSYAQHFFTMYNVQRNPFRQDADACCSLRPANDSVRSDCPDGYGVHQPLHHRERDSEDLVGSE